MPLETDSHKQLQKKISSIACARSNGKAVADTYESLVVKNVPGKMPPYYATLS